MLATLHKRFPISSQSFSQSLNQEILLGIDTGYHDGSSYMRLSKANCRSLGIPVDSNVVGSFLDCVFRPVEDLRPRSQNDLPQPLEQTELLWLRELTHSEQKILRRGTMPLVIHTQKDCHIVIGSYYDQATTDGSMVPCPVFWFKIKLTDWEHQSFTARHHALVFSTHFEFVPQSSSDD